MEKTKLVAAKKLNKTELIALAEVIIEDANKIISKKIILSFLKLEKLQSQII